MAGYIFDKRNVLVQFIQNDENIKKLFFMIIFVTAKINGRVSK